VIAWQDTRSLLGITDSCELQMFGEMRIGGRADNLSHD
jgi:hypothetical protein